MDSSGAAEETGAELEDEGEKLHPWFLQAQEQWRTSLSQHSEAEAGKAPRVQG